MSLIGTLHVGTTYVKCFIYDTNTLAIKGTAKDKVQLLTPEPGHVVINPETLFNSIVNVIKEALLVANIGADKLKCLGISTHRNSFITWNKFDGKPYHDIVTWRDTRADEFIKEINASEKLKQFKEHGKLMYSYLKIARYRGAENLMLSNMQVLPKLHFLMKNDSKLMSAMDAGVAQSGTLDTWLLYKFGTGVYVSDYTNSSATGYFSTYDLKVNDELVQHFKLKANIIPEAVNNSHDFGYIDESIFGHRIKIGAVMANQSASLLGNCCILPGDAKLTLGRGSFLNYNTGPVAGDTKENNYPIIAWSTNNETVYGIESVAKHNGAIIEWATKHKLLPDLDDSARFAANTPENNELLFVPVLDKSQQPISNEDIQLGFVGSDFNTTGSQKIRSILESLAYQAALIVENFKYETNLPLDRLKVDGGVSQNDFICQILADCTGLQIERSGDPNPTTLGVMFMAALNEGIWENKDELEGKCKMDKKFQPSQNRENQLKNYSNWKRLAQQYVKAD